MDAKRLFNKKGWTGDEAGKAIIYSLVHDYTQALSGNHDPKPLFTPAHIRNMVRGFAGSRSDIEAYNRYVNLQNWIKQYQAVANAYFQLFQSGVNEFVSVARAAETAENEYRYIERLPRILTQKQYEEIKARRVEETIAPDGEELDEAIFALVIRALEHYTRELEKDPKKANPLKAVKKLYSSIPVTNPDIIRIYNREAGHGYMTLPDGTRSDAVTPEEWKKRLLTFSPELQRLQEEADAGIAGEEGTLSYERYTKAARAAHMGEDAPEKKDNVTTWHYYEEAPEGLTKWGIIKDSAMGGGASFFDYYPYLGDGADTLEEATAQAEAFKKEFPEAVEAIIKALEALDFPLIEDKKLSAATVEEWVTITYTWRSLYESAFPGFREWVEADTTIFEGDRRALMNGIAIIRPSDLLADHLSVDGRNCTAIDAEGRYIEPDTSNIFSSMFGLESYTSDNPECGDSIAHMEDVRASVEDSLRWILGYDTALKIIAEEIGIPEFVNFHVGVERCFSRTEALNALFDAIYRDISNIDYQDKEKKAAKLQALRDVFYPIKTKELAISEWRIKEAKRMLSGLDAFGDGKAGNAAGWDFLAVLTAPEGGGDE